VGKSAGAIQIWNLLRVNPFLFRHFSRIAAVLIDPHGAVIGDGTRGSYRDDVELWWPPTWPTDRNRFRVYHIFQQREGLTGAAFRGSDKHRVFTAEITDPGVNHTNIPSHRRTRATIALALRWINRDAAA
jgi:hypothetical protein